MAVRLFSVERFNSAMAKGPDQSFTRDFMEKNRILIQSKAKSFQSKYGRGAFLIHFRTYKDYQAKKIQSTKSAITFNFDPMLHLAHKQRKLFIVNNEILWLPIHSIDLYFSVKASSSLRWYPLCAYYCIMFVTNKSKKMKPKSYRYYNCMLGQSFHVHPSSFFESKLYEFVSTIKAIRTSKYKYFKKTFPVFHKDLQRSAKIKPHSLNLISYLSDIILPHIDDYKTEYAKYCIDNPDNGQYPIYNEFITHGYSVLQVAFVITDWPLQSDPGILKFFDALLQFQWRNVFFKLSVSGKLHEIEWLLAKCIGVIQIINAMTRIMIRLYGSRCSYCDNVTDTNIFSKKKAKRNRFKVCKNCQQRYYCSKKCQKLDWNKHHRKYCSILKVVGSCCV
eukprot:160048_1